MKQSLLYNTSSFVITILLVVGILACYYFGCYVKRKRLVKHPEDKDEGLGPIEGALLGLLALLLSFSFSMSSSRHDNRFQVMVNEANTIGTAILRADLFPDSERVVIRNHFKKYVEDRIAQYNAGNNFDENNEAALQSEAEAASLWKIAVNASKSQDVVIRSRGTMMMSSLNEMIDAITTRKASRDTIVPESILWVLFLLCLAASFIIGYGTRKKPDAIVATVFAIMIAITVFSILDLDRPHRGLITLDRAEQHIVNLREMFKHY